MMYVPEFVALYEINPFIILALDNESIRVAVKDYLEGGEKKDAIVKRYGPIGDWNTSDVTDMSRLFWDAQNFNQDISKWDVSSVTNMIEMFYCSLEFNQPIGKWKDTSNVTNMDHMFYGAWKFNQPIGEWDVSKVTNMNCMFCFSHSFNQPIGNWNIDSLQIMNCMFMNSLMLRCNYFELIKKYSTKDFVIKANSITSGDFTEGLDNLVRSEIIYNERERIVNQESLIHNNQNNLFNALEARDAAKAVLDTYYFYVNCNYCIEHAHRTCYDDAINAWNTAANAYISINVDTIWNDVISNFTI